MEAPAGDPAQGRGTWRSRVYPLLDGEGRTPGSAVVRAVMVTAIVLNALAIVLATVKSLATAYGGLFAAVDDAAMVLFARRLCGTHLGRAGGRRRSPPADRGPRG